MSNTGFIFKKWESRISYYALMKLEQEKICVLETTWGSVKSKGVRVALTTTFGDGWTSVIKEAGKQSLKFGGRKALGCATGVICGYFGLASIVLITKSTRIIKCGRVCHSACSGGLDLAELCASAPINMVEIMIFGRPVIVEGEGFDLFSKDADPIEEIEKLFKKQDDEFKMFFRELSEDILIPFKFWNT